MKNFLNNLLGLLLIMLFVVCIVEFFPVSLVLLLVSVAFVWTFDKAEGKG